MVLQVRSLIYLMLSVSPMFVENYDKPAPAPAYGIAGWTADGNTVFLYDAYDWWKIDLAGECQPECLTKGYGRKHGKSIRKMTSNIDKDVFQKDETIMVSLWDKDTMDEGVYQLDMKGRLKKLMEGPYIYNIHRFSDNHKYCVWNRQSITEFRDLWWSKADFSNPVRVTNANPQQADYKWGTVKLVKWTNYENKEIRDCFICLKIMILKRNIRCWYSFMKPIPVS